MLSRGVLEHRSPGETPKELPNGSSDRALGGRGLYSPAFGYLGATKEFVFELRTRVAKFLSFFLNGQEARTDNATAQRLRCSGAQAARAFLLLFSPHSTPLARSLLTTDQLELLHTAASGGEQPHTYMARIPQPRKQSATHLL